MKQYHDLVTHVIEYGEDRHNNRTGEGTRSVFGYQCRFDLAQGLPALTTKRLNLHAVVTELLWFLTGETNTAFLHHHGVHIWDQWAGKDGWVGPIYGYQWRSWPNDRMMEGVDQMRRVIDGIRSDPFGRRHLVSAWNVGDLPDMALVPCHFAFQFYVTRNGRLSCQVYQRSADVGIGVPFNWVSYAILTHMVAQVTNLVPGELVWTGGDVHVYHQHIDALVEQLQREPRPLPTLWLDPRRLDIDEFLVSDIEIRGYDPHPWFPLHVAV